MCVPEIFPRFFDQGILRVRGLYRIDMMSWGLELFVPPNLLANDVLFCSSSHMDNVDNAFVEMELKILVYGL